METGGCGVSRSEMPWIWLNGFGGTPGWVAVCETDTSVQFNTECILLLSSALLDCVGNAASATLSILALPPVCFYLLIEEAACVILRLLLHPVRDCSLGACSKCPHYVEACLYLSFTLRIIYWRFNDAACFKHLFPFLYPRCKLLCSYYSPPLFPKSLLITAPPPPYSSPIPTNSLETH